MTPLQKSASLRSQLGIVTLARFFLNTGVRMVYPFAPAFARGLGVEVSAIYVLITLRNLVGLLSPIFGPFSERFGRRSTMVAGMLFFVVGTAVVIIWPAYWPFGAALALMALGKVVYDPSMQAYLGDSVPYQRRGRALAVTEYAWALGLLVGAPVVGLLIQSFGWVAPFIWLGLSALAAVLLLLHFLPFTRSQRQSGKSFRAAWQVIGDYPVVWAAVIYMALALTANEILFVVFGDWLEGGFGLTLAGLGLASALIGGAEIAGETFAGWSVDRYGKRPVIIISGALTAVCYFLLPFAGMNLNLALAALFLIFLFFEITIVGGMPLMTELVPSARGMVMYVLLAAMSLGRALGALIGTLAWTRGGFWLSSMLSATMMVVGVIILAKWVREGTESRKEVL